MMLAERENKEQKEKEKEEEKKWRDLLSERKNKTLKTKNELTGKSSNVNGGDHAMKRVKIQKCR